MGAPWAGPINYLVPGYNLWESYIRGTRGSLKRHGRTIVRYTRHGRT